MAEDGFPSNQKVRVPVSDESRRSALQRTKRSLVLCMVAENCS